MQEFCSTPTPRTGSFSNSYSIYEDLSTVFATGADALERLQHVRSVGSRRTLATRRRCGLGLRSGSSPRKNGSSARVLTMTAAADVIRATVHNRVDNQVRGASLANHRHRQSDRSRAVLPAVACRGATSRYAPATPSSLRRPCGGDAQKLLERKFINAATVLRSSSCTATDMRRTSNAWARTHRGSGHSRC